MSIEWWLFAAFIWFSFSTEVATGFGSIIIALALGALLLPMEAMLPVLVTLNSIMNLVLLSRLYKDIHLPTFLRRILPLMLVGMVAGMALFPYLPDAQLKLGFAVLVLWFALRELYKLYRQVTVSAMPNWLQRMWILLGGVTHGLYASGGPLLVYGLSRTQLDKTAFRATLLATWFSLNLCYTLYFAVNGTLASYQSEILYMLPVLALAAVCGQFLHHKVNEVQFKKLVFMVLSLCGVIMVVNAI